MSELTQERLKELLHYDPSTGIFTWREITSTKIRAGDIAGCRSNGYVLIRILGKQYRAHRLAWLYMDGYLPKNIGIDHKDQTPWHNWWSNLRLASQQCNIRNTWNPRDNTSGVKGVQRDSLRKKWYARVCVSGKSKYLGRYKDFDDAVCARLAGEQCLNWEGCDSNSPAYRYVQEHIQNAR